MAYTFNYTNPLLKSKISRSPALPDNYTTSGYTIDIVYEQMTELQSELGALYQNAYCGSRNYSYNSKDYAYRSGGHNSSYNGAVEGAQDSYG